MNNCPTCQAPLIRLDSQNIKLCVDYPLAHVIDNPLREGQQPLVKGQR